MKRSRHFTCASMSCVLIAIAIGACSRAPSRYTVEYYEAHDEQRQEKLRECANDPGALRDDALCINAQKAGEMKAMGNLRSSPPMGLLEAQEAREREQLEPANEIP